MSRKNRDMQSTYKGLDEDFSIPVHDESDIRPDLLVSFPYEYPSRPQTVRIQTEEFSALCPWTGLADLGRLQLEYVPGDKLLELKSLKYYLLTYRQVGVVQEHAAARIFEDLLSVLEPKALKVILDYNVRGGLQTSVELNFP